MIESWIDALTRRWGTINLGTFGQQVRSFNIVTDNDFPEAIGAEDLANGPIAQTFVPSLRPRYSQGGPRTAVWTGETWFHLAPDLAKTRLAALLPYYQAIWQAAAGSPTLGGLVELWLISEEDGGISGLDAMSYGDEALHWGLIVKWWVKEHVPDSVITVGGPGT